MGIVKLQYTLILWLVLIVGRRSVYSHNCTCIKQNCFVHFENTKPICYGEEQTAGYSCNCSYRGLSTIPEDLPNNTLALNLQGNNITNLTRYHFDEHVELVILDLRHNQIDDLPPKIFYYTTNLVELYLATKQIHSKSFRRLKNLELLYIDGEGVLSELHELMFKPLASLKNLTIHNGNIETFEKGVLMFSKKLEFLDLHNNGIREIEADSFQAGRKLRWVDFSNNRIQELHGLYGETFSENVLQVLNISHNNISIFPSFLERLEVLRNLDLSRNLLQNMSTVDLSSLKNLKTLALRGNQINAFPWDTVSKIPVSVDLSGNLLNATSCDDCELLYYLYKTAANFSGICAENPSLIQSRSEVQKLIFNKPSCNACQVQPCQNNAMCNEIANTTERFACTCQQGYTGSLCETNMEVTIPSTTTPSVTSSTSAVTSSKPSVTSPTPTMTSSKNLKNQGEKDNPSTSSSPRYKHYFETSLIVNLVLSVAVVLMLGLGILLFYKYRKLQSTAAQFKYKHDVELK